MLFNIYTLVKQICRVGHLKSKSGHSSGHLKFKSRQGYSPFFFPSGCGKAGKIALASDFSGVSTARQFPQASFSFGVEIRTLAQRPSTPASSRSRFK